MSELLFEDSLAQIEIALVMEISFALRRNSLPPAATLTLAALRQAPTNEGGSPRRTNLDMVYVAELSSRFYWWQFSTAADDGATVIKPSDGMANGRWLIVSSSLKYKGVPLAQITDGVFKEVILHNGDFNFKTLKERVYGRAPCCAIHFAGEKYKAKSQIPGALYDNRVNFEIWAVSRNERDRFEAAVGSPVAAEFAEDPGVMRLYGKLKAFLAGSNLGLGGTSPTDYSGIANVEVTEGDLDYSDLEERVFVMSLHIEVRGSLANPDQAAELEQLARIDAQRNQASVGQSGRFDLTNCITSGLDMPSGIGFSKVIAGGTAVIAGVTVTAAPFTRTFTDSVRTYRDLKPDGTWAFVELAAGQDDPPVTAGALRVGLTVTDAAGVIWDTFVASSYVPSETPDQIEV